MLDTNEPQFVFRVKANDTSLIINVKDIFENIKIKETHYPTEWKNNVNY